MKTSGLVLAAGFGTRLKPLTDYMPKPLLPVLGMPMLQHSIDGILGLKPSKGVHVNGHYLYEQVQKYCSQFSKRDIEFVHEKEILGTAGTIMQILEPCDQLYISNSDIISDFNYKRLKIDSDGDALLVCRDYHPGTNPLYVVDNQLVAIGECQLKNAKKLSFCGIYTVANKLLSFYEKDDFDIVDVFKRAVKNNGTIKTIIHDGFWTDLGTIEDYVQAQYQLRGNPKLDQMISHQIVKMEMLIRKEN